MPALVIALTVGVLALVALKREWSSAACDPSGAAMPTGDLPGGWHQVFSDNFATDTASFPGKAYGAKWNAYPDGWPDTTGEGRYMPTRTLSVRDCTLDIYLHSADGRHLVAAPVPNLPRPNTYGKFSVRFRADSLRGYKTAWLLWPDNNDEAQGEIDFPEGNLDGKIAGFVHRTGYDGKDAYRTGATYTSWHTATTTWMPGKVTFTLDGKVVGVATKGIPDKPMHWVLQTETSTDQPPPSDSTAGHVSIDWVSIWKKKP